MSVAAKAVKGTLYMAVMSYTLLPLRIIVSILLARMLLPEYFGVVALSEVIFQYINRVSLFGFDQALRQRQDDIEEAASTHRAIMTLLGFIVLILTLLASVIVARIYGALVAQIVIINALVNWIRYSTSTYSQMLEKELLYARVTVINITAFVLNAAISLTLAWLGFGVWSLVAGLVAEGLTMGLGAMLLSPYRPSLRWSKEMVRWYLRFGPFWHMFLGGLATALWMQLDKLLLGTIVGSRQLGFYSKAYNWALMPTSYITHLLSVTALSTYAKLQSDRNRLSLAFSFLLGSIARVSVPMALAMFIIAEEWVPLLLGDTWLPMVPIFQFLIPYALFRPLLDDTGALFTAIGRPWVPNNIMIFQALWMVFAGPPLVYLYGAIGAALAINIAILVGVIIAYWQLRRHIDIPYLDTLGPPLAGAAVAMIGTTVALAAMNLDNLAFRLLAKLVLIGTFYLAALLAIEGKSLLKRGQYIYSLLRARA